MNTLTPQEAHIMLHKGTEPPFSGKYDDFYEKGTYICKQCNEPLFSSESKFKSGSGWASFESCLAGVESRLDSDGRRTEIICASCGGHLGHVFVGEGLSETNTRHCVNSLSLHFIPESNQ